MSDVSSVTNDEIDAFTSERILDAAARGEIVEGFEGLSELLTAFHEPASATEMSASLPSAAVLPPASNPAIGRITRRTAAVSTVAVFALSGVAAALTGGALLLEPVFESDDPVLADEEPPADDSAEDPDDTVFNLGYDETFQLFVWNTSPTDGPNDCTLENGAVNPTYRTENGSIVVESLTVGPEGEIDVTFPGRKAETADLRYFADGDCALDAAEVAGPNGQINHGMFMRLFNSLYEGTGSGCLNRFLARSDLGKGDQQIKVDDVDADFVADMDGNTGKIVFDTFLADCERGNNGNGNGNGGEHGNDAAEAASNGGGRPDSPGQSGDAPGRDK